MDREIKEIDKALNLLRESFEKGYDDLAESIDVLVAKNKDV